ncbi:MAG: hypothetical protein JXR97_17210, partial [Planctomycetes bacterium]|nr:hypothetical protein [Planctomycetota bacterium]
MDQFITQATCALSDIRKVESGTHESVGPIQAMRWNAASRSCRIFWERMEVAVREGSKEADRPIELSFSDACLLNFGTNPKLVETDIAFTAAEKAGLRIPASHALTKEQESFLRRALGFMEMNYSETHASTGVYNLEPWLQEMFRDHLDIDYREQLLERKHILEEDLRMIPTRLMSLGIPNDLVIEIMQALKKSRSVQFESRAREKNKSSVVNARGYASIMQHLDKIMEKAEEFVTVPSMDEGRSPLTIIHECWKETSYELMEVDQELAKITNEAMDGRHDILIGLLESVQKTLARCAEDKDIPQRSLIFAAEAHQLCQRQVVEEELEALMMHDIVGQADVSSDRMETRKYGPLCAIIAPGRGVARYSEELRGFHRERLDVSKNAKRGFDLNRRATYPMNYIVVPNLTPAGDVLEDMADAFLEYKSTAHPGTYQNFISEARRYLPEGEMGQELKGFKNPTRRLAARYIAGFVRWAKYGKLIDLPRLSEF